MARRVGRPIDPNAIRRAAHTLSITLPITSANALNVMADALGVSKAECIRLLIAAGYLVMRGHVESREIGRDREE